MAQSIGVIFLKIIRDKKQIEFWLEKGNILKNFDTQNLIFEGYRYEKGEYIITPGERLDKILFLVEGTVQIYWIRDDGSISPVNQVKNSAVIGDLEFSNYGIPPFFVEAKSSVICIALSTQKYRRELDCDLRFLHMLLKSYAEKIEVFSTLDVVATTLEERVLLYLNDICPSHELKGIEATLSQLRCSRRQLQRVLKKLCEENKIEKIGKGRYRLKCIL